MNLVDETINNQNQLERVILEITFFQISVKE